MNAFILASTCILVQLNFKKTPKNTLPDKAYDKGLDFSTDAFVFVAESLQIKNLLLLVFYLVTHNHFSQRLLPLYLIYFRLDINIIVD